MRKIYYYIISYLFQILIFFVLKFDEDEEERKNLMKSRPLRFRNFIGIILFFFVPFPGWDPAVIMRFYLVNLIIANFRASKSA